jgi:hypothetical protein
VLEDREGGSEILGKKNAAIDLAACVINFCHHIRTKKYRHQLYCHVPLC